MWGWYTLFSAATTLSNLLEQFSEENSEGMHRIPGREYFQYLNETHKTLSFPEYLRESDEALSLTSSPMQKSLFRDYKEWYP